MDAVVGRVGTASRHSCLEVGTAPRAVLGAKVDASSRCRVTATRASAPQDSAFQPSAIGFGVPAYLLSANRSPLPPIMSRVGTASRHSCIEVGTAPRAVLGASIFRSQVSAIGYQVQVFGFWCRSGPDTRNLRNVSASQHASVSADPHAALPRLLRSSSPCQQSPPRASRAIPPSRRLRRR